MAPGIEVNPQNQHGEGLEHHQGSGTAPQPGTPEQARHKATNRPPPRPRPIRSTGYPPTWPPDDRRPPRARLDRFWCCGKQAQTRHQYRRAARREQVELADEHTVKLNGISLMPRSAVNLGFPYHLPQRLDQNAQADGGHEQGNLGLVHQGSQHHLSITTPNSTMMARVSNNASQNGTPMARMLTKLKAANSTMGFAKFTPLKPCRSARSPGPPRIHHAGQQAADQHFYEKQHAMLLQSDQLGSNDRPEIGVDHLGVLSHLVGVPSAIFLP